jgi:protein disulfide-isomerase
MQFVKWHLAALLAIFVTGANAAVLPGWHTNFVVAHSQSKAEGKLMLVHFSGSDWCGWCMKLQKEVFQKAEFQDYARSNLVLVAVDFPKRKVLPPAVQEANQALATKYQVEGFPTLLVLDSDGSMLGVLAFGDGGPKSFIKELEKVVAQSAVTMARGSGPISAATKANPAPRGGLQLQGIVAKKGRRLAKINNETLTAGQSAKVRIASGEINIRCLEIRDASVIVRVEGRKEPLELRLAQRL